MAGLSAFGAFHTAISLVAVAAGFVSLAKYKDISSKTKIGQVYIWTTVATCITGFFIFHHGGFGAPHALGIITLVTLAVAAWTERGREYGWRTYFSMLAYSMTLFFHAVPAITETTSRLPASAPLTTGPDDPLVKAMVGVAFLLFLIGAGIQVWRLRVRHRMPLTA